MPVGTWTAIVPIRSLDAGKSRLTGRLDAPTVTEAFARDVLAACSQCPEIGDVLVVTSDPDAVALAEDCGARGVIQVGTEGINAAIALARGQVGPGEPVVAILGDTPCLTGGTLSTVLAAANDHDVSFVADTAGTGSTMWCAKDPSATPYFGEHSRAHHRAAGAVELGGDQRSEHWLRARRDVDTEIDLWDAQRIGVGPATARALA